MGEGICAKETVHSPNMVGRGRTEGEVRHSACQGRCVVVDGLCVSNMSTCACCSPPVYTLCFRSSWMQAAKM